MITDSRRMRLRSSAVGSTLRLFSIVTRCTAYCLSRTVKLKLRPLARSAWLPGLVSSGMPTTASHFCSAFSTITRSPLK